MDNNPGGGRATANEYRIEIVKKGAMTSILEDMKAELKWLNESASQLSSSIFRVPHEACRPRLVSIGPYHHGKKHLQKLQEYKGRYLQTMLDRTQPHGIHLEDLINVVAPKEKMIRQCYWESTNKFSGSNLVRMMILDGCFIIELIRQIAGHRQSDDILSNNSYMYISLVRDLLRLENQLPYFVLEDLFKTTNVSQEKTSFTILALSFFDSIMERSDRFSERDRDFEVMHLLDLLRLSLITGGQQIIGPAKRRSSYELIGSASKLSQAGIAFARREASTFLEIKFDSKMGIMQIPKLRTDDTLQCILHNMVAFERCFVNCDKHFTAYAIFMRSLIDTANDAQLLGDHGIMWNDGVSKEGIASFFRDVSKDAVWDVSKSYLELEIERVSSYVRRQQIRVFFARLIYTPCRYTWSTIAAVLMLTGAIQTVYTMLQYYHPR